MWFGGLQLFIAILLEYNVMETRNIAMTGWLFGMSISDLVSFTLNYKSEIGSKKNLLLKYNLDDG